MLKILNLFLLMAVLLLTIGCKSDIGLSYNVVERFEIVGDIAIQSREVYDQSLDILFIVDKSCSMDDDIETLQNSMPLIYDELLSKDFTDLDWRLGVKSADPNDDILEEWVEWDDENIDLKLNSLLSSESSSLLGREAGLDSAVNSLAWDEEFHREHSDTLIVYMSDEPDQSAVTVSGYESLVSNYKTYPFLVTEASIVPTWLDSSLKTRCDNAVEIGTGYIEVSETVVDLCNSHKWPSILDFVKQHVPTLNKIWPLEYTPLDSESISVEVDGAPWSKWHYDEASNSIIMDKIPKTGSLVVIAYLIP